MKPTVGRIVHFFPSPLDVAARSNNNDGPLAAIITRVWSDEVVNLVVFPDFNLPQPYGSVQQRRTSDSPGWDWPTREEEANPCADLTKIRELAEKGWSEEAEAQAILDTPIGNFDGSMDPRAGLYESAITHFGDMVEPVRDPAVIGSIPRGVGYSPPPEYAPDFRGAWDDKPPAA